ncbi:MAG: endonuclease III [Myxococcota bacterium]
MTAESTSAQKLRINKILQVLSELCLHSQSALIVANPFQRLIATILSAQSTDKQVNKITRELFEYFPDPASLATAPPAKVEDIIRSTGLYRNKTKNIIAASRIIMEKFAGQVPKTMNELTSLPGVARKTANCVLQDSFQIAEGIVVDTHVGRLAMRLKLTSETKKNPVKIEKDLKRVIPRSQWLVISHRLIYHGRNICKARNPLCRKCRLLDWCPSGKVD